MVAQSGTATVPSDVSPLLEEGAEDYNEGAFWEAHEAWEEAWHLLRDEGLETEADIVQGLILATAAFENLDRGKPDGFAVQGAKALTRLRQNPGHAARLGVENEPAFRDELLEVYLLVQRKRIRSLDEVPDGAPRLTIRS